jgi:demethylmenaquinone methyltransferase/2-methoxy-6-polyprenyl-1,4-benzoquinol methylase
MFDNIAHRYDFLNHFFSVGIDQLWRKRLVRELKDEQPGKVLDLATGTGDLALEVNRKTGAQVIGGDIAEQMLEKGREKFRKKGVAEDSVELRYADAEALDFPDESFDAVVVAFGIRNYEDLEKGLREMLRVLKKDGVLLVLEFTQPRGLIRPFFRLYFRYIMPTIGKWISGDSKAYSYLPESVRSFPEREALVRIMQDNGYRTPSYSPLTAGIASLYRGRK